MCYSSLTVNLYNLCSRSQIGYSLEIDQCNQATSLSIEASDSLNFEGSVWHSKKIAWYDIISSNSGTIKRPQC